MKLNYKLQRREHSPPPRVWTFWQALLTGYIAATGTVTEATIHLPNMSLHTVLQAFVRAIIQIRTTLLDGESTTTMVTVTAQYTCLASGLNDVSINPDRIFGFRRAPGGSWTPTLGSKSSSAFPLRHPLNFFIPLIFEPNFFDQKLFWFKMIKHKKFKLF